jgi:hypothetical protein
MRVETRRLEAVAAIALAWCVAVPAGVSGQAPPGARQAGTPGTHVSVSAYGFNDFTSLGATSGPPAGLRVGASLFPLLQRMWQHSPTFRRQCAQVEEAGVAISVYLGLPRGRTGVHALTRIEVQAGLATHATVYLEPTLWRATELLAHEIEHVLELIDGVDLRVLAIDGVQGVHQVGDGYETSRAVALGRLVAREVSAYGHETQDRHQ